ncbi:MAG: selenocysteine-specific translation elongation factor [Candidatus Limnocylindrales bacterium]
MTVVVGTAGHIDHGKTALLKALTGIDADRLPEERRRGMTIDLGYAHMTLAPGVELDFVDVPGHDRLVGNMLVGAGEIDAVLLVVAADEGIGAQTREHLGLLDALGIGHGVVALTKLDLLAPDDPRRVARATEIRALLEGTTLAESPIAPVSARTGEGLDALREALDDLRRRVEAISRLASAGPRLAVDRVFTVKGRGLVVTGTLRGGAISRGDTLRVEPAASTVRVREIQVHNAVVEAVAGGGRVALNLAGIDQDLISRGMVLSAGPAVMATRRLLVSLRPAVGGRAPTAGAELRLHLGTDEVLGRWRPVVDGADDVTLGALTLTRPVAAALDDLLVLRRPSPAETAAGGRVLDPLPPSRLGRRRPDGTAVDALAARGTAAQRLAALLAVHGALDARSAGTYGAALGIAAGAVAAVSGAVETGRVLLDPALAAAIEAELLSATTADGVPAAVLRASVQPLLRRATSLGTRDRAEVIEAMLDRLVGAGRLERDGDTIRLPGPRTALPPATLAAMERLVAALRTATPADLADAASGAGCPPEGLRALETSGRIVRLTPSLAYAAEIWADLQSMALGLAARGAVTPAELRDASGTSRKYAVAVLEELDSRGLLRRGPDGHRLGPRAPSEGRV